MGIAPVLTRSWIVKGRIAFYGAIPVGAALLVAYATAMPGTSYRGPPLEPSPEEKRLEGNLLAHVVTFSEVIGERHVGRGDSLGRAREYALSVIRQIPGLRSDQVRLEDVGAEGRHAQNVVVDVAGETPELVVVGAHYDSAQGAPGADDNATGVAAALELLRELSKTRMHKTLRIVLFANEEPPYFQSEGMGSLVHAKAARSRGDQIDAMLSLESVGYFSDAAGSQQYPWPIGLLYPDRGDFVAFVGNVGSRALVRRAIGTFRSAAAFPSEGAALPESIPGVGWSDQWAFWQLGYRAIMVTDTAPFRNPQYHMGRDSAATIDYQRLARVTRGLARVVEELAGKPLR